ncbi:MAG: flagellar filament outer layer protein FlaA [Spirochaetaceae bacterium]|nr:flagellar filament outer layer protein FlaA [Spirochaetaceae bacterium]
MKRLLALSGIFLLSAGLAFAETSTLIDFNDLVADNGDQNAATTINFGQFAGSSFTQAERDSMQTSLAIANWNVIFNASARTRQSLLLSRTQQVDSAFLGVATMGVRIFFPPFNSAASATITPPFEIPSLWLADDGGDINRFDNRGVVKNVGEIRSISLDIRGLNFPHHVSIILSDFDGRTREIPMGNLRFDGWRTLTWNNPAYVFEVRRRQLEARPLYPFTIPLIKLQGIRIHRDASMPSGDFITNIARIEVAYDLAVRNDVPQDIDDEAMWGILHAREATRMTHEMRNFGERQILEFVEGMLIDTSTPRDFSADGNIPMNTFAPTPGAAGG